MTDSDEIDLSGLGVILFVIFFAAGASHFFREYSQWVVAGGVVLALTAIGAVAVRNWTSISHLLQLRRELAERKAAMQQLAEEKRNAETEVRELYNSRPNGYPIERLQRQIKSRLALCKTGEEVHEWLIQQEEEILRLRKEEVPETVVESPSPVAESHQQARQRVRLHYLRHAFVFREAWPIDKFEQDLLAKLADGLSAKDTRRVANGFEAYIDKSLAIAEVRRQFELLKDRLPDHFTQSFVDIYIADQLSFGRRTAAEVHEAARLFIETMHGQAAPEPVEETRSDEAPRKSEQENEGWSTEAIAQFEASVKQFCKEARLAGMTEEEVNQEVTAMRAQFE